MSDDRLAATCPGDILRFTPIQNDTSSSSEHNVAPFSARQPATASASSQVPRPLSPSSDVSACKPTVFHSTGGAFVSNGSGLASNTPRMGQGPSSSASSTVNGHTTQNQPPAPAPSGQTLQAELFRRRRGHTLTGRVGPRIPGLSGSMEGNANHSMVDDPRRFALTQGPGAQKNPAGLASLLGMSSPSPSPGTRLGGVSQLLVAQQLALSPPQQQLSQRDSTGMTVFHSPPAASQNANELNTFSRNFTRSSSSSTPSMASSTRVVEQKWPMWLLAYIAWIVVVLLATHQVNRQAFIAAEAVETMLKPKLEDSMYMLRSVALHLANERDSISKALPLLNAPDTDATLGQLRPEFVGIDIVQRRQLLRSEADFARQVEKTFALFVRTHVREGLHCDTEDLCNKLQQKISKQLMLSSEEVITSADAMAKSPLKSSSIREQLAQHILSSNERNPQHRIQHADNVVASVECSNRAHQATDEREGESTSLLLRVLGAVMILVLLSFVLRNRK